MKDQLYVLTSPAGSYVFSGCIEQLKRALAWQHPFPLHPSYQLVQAADVSAAPIPTPYHNGLTCFVHKHFGALNKLGRKHPVHRYDALGNYLNSYPSLIATCREHRLGNHTVRLSNLAWGATPHAGNVFLIGTR